MADEVWVGLALLHRENPERTSFSAGEIVDRIAAERAHAEVRPGVKTHISEHAVANVPPNSGKYRILYRMPDTTYRLFRPGDDYHPGRGGKTKTKPERSELPNHYHDLLAWYENTYCASGAQPDEEQDDPILRMRGLGKEIWEGIDPDAYVAELRAGWDSEVLDGPAPGSLHPVGKTDLADRVWSRIAAHQGVELRTKTGLPFTYTLEGNTGVWFYRDGQRIEKRLWRGDIEKAVARCPLEKVTDLRDCFDPAYLYGLLMDPRIRGEDW